MSDGLYQSFLPPSENGEPQRIGNVGFLVMSGVGRVEVDIRGRTLMPASNIHGDRLLDHMYGDPSGLVQRMDLVERMASESFGVGCWRWFVHTTYHVTSGCES